MAAVDALQRPSVRLQQTRIPCRRAASQRQFNHLIVGMCGWSSTGDERHPSMASRQIGAKLLHRFALRGTSGKRALRPKIRLLRLCEQWRESS